MVSPIKHTTLLLGFIISGIIRGLTVAVVVIIITLLFTPLKIHSFPTIAGVVLLSSCLFSLAGLINAIYAKSFDEIAIIPTFILNPLTYLGGVFYSITLLPKGWQYFSQLNPIIYIINAFRFGFLGISETSITVAFLMMSAFILVLFFYAYYLISHNSLRR